MVETKHPMHLITSFFDSLSFAWPFSQLLFKQMACRQSCIVNDTAQLIYIQYSTIDTDF